MKIVESIEELKLLVNVEKQKGRKHVLAPTPVHLLAQENNIPILTPEKLDDQAFINEFVVKLFASFV